MKGRTPTSRVRRSASELDAERRTNAIADNLGREVRPARRRLRLSQAELGRRVGVHQTTISRIEAGRGAAVPLALWVALGVALERPYAVSFSKPLDPGANLADAGHLEIQEALVATAVATGRTASVERPSRADAPSHSTDVAIHDEAHRVRILAEAWNTFGDLGAAIRSTTRKLAEVVAAEGGTGCRVATVWVVRASTANRSILSSYPNLLAATFPGSSATWVRCLAEGGPPPEKPGLVWFDPATRRLTAWHRRRASSDH